MNNFNGQSEQDDMIDEDLLSTFLLDQDLFSSSGSSAMTASSSPEAPHEATTPETDLLFGFSYESLAGHVHGANTLMA